MDCTRGGRDCSGCDSCTQSWGDNPLARQWFHWTDKTFNRDKNRKHGGGDALNHRKPRK